MFRRKAKWIYWRERGIKQCKCSKCKTSYGCMDTPYCPNCGRRMVGTIKGKKVWNGIFFSNKIGRNIITWNGCKDEVGTFNAFVTIFKVFNENNVRIKSIF